MPNIKQVLGAACALAFVAFATPSLAEQGPPEVAAPSSAPCGGQYECLEIRLLTLEEAQASRAFQQIVQAQAPATFATLVSRNAEKQIK
jgi:hypothetical protein